MTKKKKSFGKSESQFSLYGGISLDTGAEGGADSYKAPTTGRCYETHPVLELGGGKFIGGSCSSPMSNLADVYIGFEKWMTVVDFDYTQRDVVTINYPIVDMQAPANHKTFTKLIEYTAKKLAEGKTVHAGCIGGHGRTGTFLAALVKHVTGNEDAITWVRENYCKKAVESEVQVEFLNKHFGIKAVASTKQSYYTTPSKYPTPSTVKKTNSNWPYASGGKEIKTPPKAAVSTGLTPHGVEKSFTPVGSKKDILKAALI